MGGGSNRQSMCPPLCQSESTAIDRDRSTDRDRKPLASAGYLTLSYSSASLKLSMQDATTERE
jgi:hypothetical protein